MEKSDPNHFWSWPASTDTVPGAARTRAPCLRRRAVRRFSNILSEQLLGSRRWDVSSLGLCFAWKLGIKAEAGKEAQTLHWNERMVHVLMLRRSEMPGQTPKLSLTGVKNRSQLLPTSLASGLRIIKHHLLVIHSPDWDPPGSLPVWRQ